MGPIKSRGKSKFKNEWYTTFPWARPLITDNNSVRCLYCNNAVISLSNMGKRSLESHENSGTHQTNKKHWKTIPKLTEIFSTGNDVQNTTNGGKNSPSITSSQVSDGASVIENGRAHQSMAAAQKDMRDFTTNEMVTRAAILFILNGVHRHLSYRDMESFIEVFREMDPDSEIARRLQLSKSTISYTITHGIAYNFEKKLINSLESCEDVVVGFDESLNKIEKKQQLDIMLKFWDSLTKQVATRYYTSVFLGRTRAVDIYQALVDKLPRDVLKKIVQISMDGPNVNWVVHRDLEKLVAQMAEGKTFIDLGSCGLHITHNAFKKSFTPGPKDEQFKLKLKWDIAATLRALFNLLNDSSARRLIYEDVSILDLFPMFFSGTRWTENGCVAERSRKILPNMKKYVAKVSKDKKLEPTCQSYGVVKEALKDEFLDAKLAFFQTLASDLEPYLTEFQSNEPKIPLLYNALRKMTINVMRRVIKLDELTKANKNLCKMDLADDSIFLSAEKVKLGYATADALSKVADGPNILQFKNDCRTILKAFLVRYLQKCPLKYPIVRGVSCFDPLVAVDQDLAVHRLSVALKKFVETKIIASSTAEYVEREFSELISLPSVRKSLKLAQNTKQRLDSFWMETIETHGEKNYSNLIFFLKKVLIISRGNADLERAFSINKECLAENQKERSLVAQRIICDTINATGQKAHKFVIDKDLMNDVKFASSRYKSELAKNQKENKEADERLKKEKKKASEIKIVENELQEATKEYLHKTASLESKLCELKKS